MSRHPQGWGDGGLQPRRSGYGGGEQREVRLLHGVLQHWVPHREALQAGPGYWGRLPHLFPARFSWKTFQKTRRDGHSPHNGFAPTPNCHIVGFVTHWLYVRVEWSNTFWDFVAYQVFFLVQFQKISKFGRARGKVSFFKKSPGLKK